jgi:hypothetical protein
MTTNELADLCERQASEIAALLIALHDAITRPQGVVPASADRFYVPAMADAALRARG